MLTNAPRDLSRLSPDLAFVVQLVATDPQDPRSFKGRVEHIASGRAGIFASLEELQAFIQQTMASSSGK